MKGIAHFVTGVAMASCFPVAVQAGLDGNPLYFILGGCFGLLPDTLDFKIGRFFYKYDMEIAPDPNAPDAEMVADAIAGAINVVYHNKRAVNIKLDTVRAGNDLWYRYKILLNGAERKVIVQFAEAVDTGMHTVSKIKSTPHNKLNAEKTIDCDIDIDYMSEISVDILDGPVLRIEPSSSRRVTIHFLPWHRSWSHSFIIALLAALTGVVIWDGLAGGIIFLAWSAHVIVDQLGFMGCNLFYPFTHRRHDGFRFIHSGEPLPNLFLVWAGILFIFWNLAGNAAIGWFRLNPIWLFSVFMIIPLLLFSVWRKIKDEKKRNV